MRLGRAKVAPSVPDLRLSPWVSDGYFISVAIVASGCLAWTVWIMLLTIAPNDTINRLMDTTTFDDGSFWRLIDPHPSSVLLGLLGLSCVAFAYLYIIARVTIFRHRKFSGWSRLSSFQSFQLKHRSLNSAKIAVKAASTSKDMHHDTRVSTTKYAIVKAFAKMSTTVKRKRILMSVALKFVDFGIQLYLLIDMMEKGLPVVLIAVFTAVVVLNALATAVIVAGFSHHPGLPELFLDTIFDIMVAVGIPMLVLVYCLSTFHFDRKLLAINLEVFPPGFFERGASVNSDPVQPEIIRSSLNALRIFSVTSVFARVGTNCALCRRFYQLAAVIKDPVKRSQRIYPKHRPSAIAFVIIAMATIIFVEESVRTSAVACRPHPECVQYARRWIMLSSDEDLTQCPCLKLIDEHPGPKTYDEWVSPPNVFDKVSRLARSGDLQMLSLVNRRLSTFPEELRGCTNLRHLSLVYADTETLPSWTKEFTKLEYFHIEGKHQLDELTELPKDTFEGMTSLTFLHFAAISVYKLPPMKSLVNLKYLALAELLNLQELPSFEGMRSLDTMILAMIPQVDSIPDTSPLTSLNMFATFDRGSFCCNGFIGACNLTHSLCMESETSGSPAAVCLPPVRESKIPTAATLKTFARFRMTVCSGEATRPGDIETGPTRASSHACGGIMYRQCNAPTGGIGMCYSTRLMGIACGRNALAQAMRRRQIAEGIGEPCDPVYEAWLGCDKGN